MEQKPKGKTRRGDATLEHFLAKAHKKHGDKYDYSKVSYGDEKVVIVCPKHGDFSQRPAQHVYANGCPKCGIERKVASRTKTLQQFIEEANEKHNHKYDYSTVVYKNVGVKVSIVCPKHGTFSQKPNDHLFGYGCSKCGTEKVAKSLRITKEEFIDRAMKLHQNKYDYSQVLLGEKNTCQVKIVCLEHGEFRQSPKNHLQGHGCAKCISVGFSKKACNWIDEISEQLEIKIRHAKSTKGEKRIKPPQGRTIYVDGYCKQTNTVYEFHGCIWHGCPECFDPDYTSPITGKTMREHHDKTLKREKIIRDLEYNLEVVWECKYTPC